MKCIQEQDVIECEQEPDIPMEDVNEDILGPPLELSQVYYYAQSWQFAFKVLLGQYGSCCDSCELFIHNTLATLPLKMRPLALHPGTNVPAPPYHTTEMH